MEQQHLINKWVYRVTHNRNGIALESRNESEWKWNCMASGVKWWRSLSTCCCCWLLVTCFSGRVVWSASYRVSGNGKFNIIKGVFFDNRPSLLLLLLLFIRLHNWRERDSSCTQVCTGFLGCLYGSTYCFLAWPCSVRVVLLLYFFQFNNKIRDVKLKVSQRSSGCRWEQNRTEEVEYKFTSFSVLWRSPGSSGLMMVAVRYVLLLKLNQAECDEKKLVILVLELNGFSSSSDIL